MAAEQTCKIIMVDDDRGLLETNRDFFVEQGYTVACAENAKDALSAVLTARYDCMVLDIDLPDRDGYDICAAVREASSLPIVFLSSYTEEENRIRGLSIGGDDFVCKPCSLVELELRVRLRIQSHAQDRVKPPFRLGKLYIDPENREAFYGGQLLEFTRIEFDTFYFLACRPGKTYTYEQLYDCVWHEPINMGRHSIQVRIGEIRKKLAALCPDQEYIRTIRYKGYQFVPNIE